MPTVVKGRSERKELMNTFEIKIKIKERRREIRLIRGRLALKSYRYGKRDECVTSLGYEDANILTRHLHLNSFPASPAGPIIHHLRQLDNASLFLSVLFLQ